MTYALLHVTFMITYPCLSQRNGQPCLNLGKFPFSIFCDDDTCDSEILEGGLSVHPTQTVVVNNIDFAMDAKRREEAGITHVVSVCPLTAEETKAIKPAGFFTHLIIPVQDEATEDLLIWLPHAVAWIRKALTSGHYSRWSKWNASYATGTPRVLIHCHMGMSRSVTVACALVMRVTGMSPVEALYHVKWKRRIANPNPSFRRQLNSYERTLDHAKSGRVRRHFYGKLKPEIILIIATYIFLPRRRRRIHPIPLYTKPIGLARLPLPPN